MDKLVFEALTGYKDDVDDIVYNTEKIGYKEYSIAKHGVFEKAQTYCFTNPDLDSINVYSDRDGTVVELIGKCDTSEERGCLIYSSGNFDTVYGAILECVKFTMEEVL